MQLLEEIPLLYYLISLLAKFRNYIECIEMLSSETIEQWHWDCLKSIVGFDKFYLSYNNFYS